MDRIFEKAGIEDIYTHAKQAIVDTLDCIENIKSIAGEISATAASVPIKAKLPGLGTSAAKVQTNLDKDNYNTTKTKLEQCYEKACSIIPAFDAQYADQMKELTAGTEKIKQVVEELLEFMLETPLTTPAEQFAALVEAKQTRWIQALENVKADLDGALAQAKGAEEISTIFSEDPVNLSTGNFIYDKEDLLIQGQTPFIFRRFYNSRNSYAGSLGKDWNHNYEVGLRFTQGTKPGSEEVTIMLEDGKEETFLPVSETVYTPGNQSLAELKKTEGGYAYTTLAGETYLFDKEGLYLRREDNNGQGFTLSYETAGEGKRLSKVCKDSGESFTLSYDKDGYLKSVTNHTGRTFTYEMKDGHLRKAIRPDGGTFAYEYDGSGKLISVTNPRGIVTVENEFDEKHRTTLQKFPDGTTMSYEYDDDKHTVIQTERNGTKTIHIHDDKYRNIKNIYPDGEESFVYNSRNQKIKVTDKLGHETRLSYDNRGNLTGIISPLGTKLSITYETHNKPTNIKINGKEKQKNVYDGKGNLLEISDALLRKTAFTYNEAGLPKSITQPDGSSIKIEYDAKGNIAEVTNAVGGKTCYAYDALNRATKVTDPKGNTMDISYDEAGNIHTLTNAVGDVRTYEYNASNKLVKLTDFDGSVIKREYNVLNKPEKITDQQGRETLLQYDAMWNLARITAPDGAKTTYLYNENNRLSRIKDALGNTLRFEYDGNGNCTSRADQAGNTTRFTYDALGRLICAQGPDGAELTYVYDEEGRVTEVKDALDNTVRMEYDEVGQLIKETGPMGESRTYTYSLLGKVESITDEAGLTTAYEYLPGGQLKMVCYPDGTKESYTYDLNGNIQTRIDKNGFVLTYDYDSLDRIVRVTGSGGEKKEYTYDATGNVTSLTDAKGNVTRYAYSLTGKLTKVTDALGNETVYTYDPCDRLMEIHQYGDLPEAQRQNEDNRICHVTRYERNLLGQVTAVTDPLGQTERYTYDVKGQLATKLDKEGYLTKYGYTAHGDVNHIQYEDGREVKLSYNPLRQLQEMEDWLGITRIENDPMGRATKVQYPDGKEISYTYGKLGERTSITYPDGKEALYSYDDNMRLISLQDKEGTIRYAYDGLGRLSKKTFPGGMETLYAYNEKGFLAELTHRDSEGILDRYAYQYDLMGNKTVIEKERRGLAEESGTYTYGYDPLGRLSEVTKDGELLRTYGYDAFGNRTGMREGSLDTTYTYNAMNQLICKADAMNEETYTYDNRGNLSLIMENGIMKNRYTYGALNRLEQAVNHDGEKASYEYNGLGHRVGKMIGSETPDPERQIHYTIDLTRNYHNLLQKEEGGNIQTYLWDGNVAGMIEEGRTKSPREEAGLYGRTVQYYFQDELGSPIRLMDRDGSLGESYGYDEFGQDLYGNQGKHQPFGYTGYQMDKITGTYYAQAREYKPEQGRFAAVDIIKGVAAVPYTLNEYGYCWGNPMVLVDRDGREPDSGKDYPGEWTPGSETDYTGVYYLNAPTGAGTFGHTAILFEREDGSGTFYSYAPVNPGDPRIMVGISVDGYLHKAELSSEEMDAFFGVKNSDPVGNVPERGKIITDGYNTEALLYDSQYTRYIYIPIENDEGKRMSFYAEMLRDRYAGKDVSYNLYGGNCQMAVQDILSQGGKQFSIKSSEAGELDEILALCYPISINGNKSIVNMAFRDYFDQTIPNAAYRFGITTRVSSDDCDWEEGKIKKVK